MSYTYLLVDLFSIAIPLACSFDKRINLHRKWNSVIPAIVIPAVFFLVWDAIFTDIGVWGFNRSHLLGVYLFGLPVEEILFFICIPYSVLFTHVVMAQLVKKDLFAGVARPFATFGALVMVVVALCYSERAYTFTTAATTAVCLGAVAYWDPPSWSRILFTYLVILIPFFLVNGILTGTGLEEPVVWYDDNENLGIRLLTIPVEDSVYGLLMITTNILLFEYFDR